MKNKSRTAKRNKTPKKQSEPASKMTLAEYEDFVTGLASKWSMRNFDTKISTAAMGLAGEAGEVIDITKKVLFHGMEWNEEVRQHFIKELSDIVWYVAFAARNVCGLSIQDLIDINVAKLEARYKSGKFSKKAFMKKEKAKKSHKS
jgi:NTP pyrophosphatase (non-canonical NTP hydrolase)